MRRQAWTTMSDDDRTQLCDRGLAEIFDPALRAAIAALIDDVAQHGDEAVCRATARFDRIELTPDQLRVSAEEIAAARVQPELERAIDDAIGHLRVFNEHVRDRASAWSVEIEPGL